MMQSRNWMQKLADSMELDGEVLPGVSVVEIAGDSRVLIEHHGGITQYSKEQIGVKVRYGSVCISGCGLEVTRMSRQQLVITGRIDSLQLQRRCR